MPKSALMPAEVSMTAAQIKKLIKGGTILLKAESIKGTGTRIHLAPSKHKKLTRAGLKEKGFRLSMTPDEISGSGMTLPAPKTKKGIPKSLELSGLDGKPDEKGGKINLKKIGRQITSGVNQGLREYREKVKPVVGPVLKEGVKQAISKGLPAAAAAAATAAGQPALAPYVATATKLIADKYADQATEAIGKTTGAYGMMRGVRLQDNYSNFLNSQHPAQNPALPLPDNSLPIVGGSFRAIGGHRTGGYGIMGTPMNPRLPYGDNSIMRSQGKGFRSI